MISPRLPRFLRPALVFVLVVLPTACGGESSDTDPSSLVSSSEPATPTLTPSGSLEDIGSLLVLRDAGSWRAEGVDEIEVWICRVPVDSAAAVYGGLPLRLPLTAEGVAEVLNARVAPYFEEISHGLYQPQFYAGSDATVRADQEPQVCVEQAIQGADDTADAVLVVADAEHIAEHPGGFGNVGVPCPAEPPCPVLDSRRAAYVGASDFNPDWGDAPPMDLVEHEIGHTLGWTHSGFVDGAAVPYQSALDVMSNSAAPRDTDPTRRDGPNTLAINLLFAGWLPTSDLWVAPLAGGSVSLQSSTGGAGTRLAIAPLPNGSYLTVELLTVDGFNSHLPLAGIAVHRVVITAEGTVEAIVPLVGEAPYVDLLQAGATIDVDGWRIVVLEDMVSITPIA